MTKEQLEVEVLDLKPWYHKITLPFDVVTPGEPYDHIWGNIRNSRKHIDYSGKRVLDLAAFDGMWSFEAESLGAKLVIATDCNWAAYRNFLFCKRALDSKVIPLYNVPPHDIVSRLDSYLQGHNVHYNLHDKIPPMADDEDPKFDVVHHTGLFYHLLNPAISLQQCRSVMKTGGSLLLETACDWSKEPVMRFSEFGGDYVYDDETTWWAPSISCLEKLLAVCGFLAVQESIFTIDETAKFGRVAMVARAIPPSEMNQPVYREMMNHYRTPGLFL